MHEHLHGPISVDTDCGCVVPGSCLARNGKGHEPLMILRAKTRQHAILRYFVGYLVC